MYHVINDKRARVSSEMLYVGLMDCLKTKPLSELTITEISDRAGVGRTTFYRNFDNPIDILHMKCDACFDEATNDLIHEYERGVRDSEALLACFLRYWMDHIDLMNALIDANRLDIIYSCHRLHFDKLMSTLFPQVNKESDDYVYFVSLRSGLLTGSIMAWGTTGRKKNPEEVAAIIVKYLKDFLKGNYQL